MMLLAIGGRAHLAGDRPGEPRSAAELAIWRRAVFPQREAAAAITRRTLLMTRTRRRLDRRLPSVELDPVSATNDLVLAEVHPTADLRRREPFPPERRQFSVTLRPWGRFMPGHLHLPCLAR